MQISRPLENAKGNGGDTAMHRKNRTGRGFVRARGVHASVFAPPQIMARPQMRVPCYGDYITKCKRYQFSLLLKKYYIIASEATGASRLSNVSVCISRGKTKKLHGMFPLFGIKW